MLRNEGSWKKHKEQAPQEESPDSSEIAPTDSRELLCDALESLKEFSEEDFEEKISIIQRLPVNFIEEMKAHLRAVDEENMARGKSPAETKREQLGYIKGELFERLVQAHPQEFFEKFELPLPDPEDPKENLRLRSYDPNDPLENYFLSLLHDPERFAVARGDANRNPDLVFADVRTHTICAVGEAKTGLLDYRAYDQLSSFEETIEDRLEGVRDRLAEVKGIQENMEARIEKRLYRRFREDENFMMEVYQTIREKLSKNPTDTEIREAVGEEIKARSHTSFTEEYATDLLASLAQLRSSNRLGKVLIVTEDKIIPEYTTTNEDLDETVDIVQRQERVTKSIQEERKIIRNLIKTRDFRGNPKERERKIQEFVNLLMQPDVLLIKARFNTAELEQMSKAIFAEIEHQKLS